ncbi:MAG: alpha/beta fold hydrolase, partial [Myxococcota bacterium]
RRLRRSFFGHYFTIAPWLRSPFEPHPDLVAQHFRFPVADPLRGEITLTGRLHQRGRTALLVLVHGMGGSAQSPYIRRACRQADEAGFDCLRLNLRGADRRGEDFYHGGQSEDLHRVLRAKELRGYRDIYILGYSLGGHMVLRFASEAADPRVRSVAAVCAPLDLRRGATIIDQRRRAPYRHRLLGGLKEMYREIDRRGGPLPLSVDDALRIQYVREWDDRIVAPRYGFASADAYYRKVSAANGLHELRLPALLVAAEADPMVTAASIRPVTERASRLHTVWLEHGGHVGFPREVDLGTGPDELEPQLLRWLCAPDSLPRTAREA